MKRSNSTQAAVLAESLVAARYAACALSIAILLLGGQPASADSYYTSASQTAGTSWNAVSLWSTSTSGAGGTYTITGGDVSGNPDHNDFTVVNGGLVRNNSVSSGPTYFGGHSLTLNTGGEIRFKGITPSYVDFGELTDPTGGLFLNGGYIDTGDDASYILKGRITLQADSSITYQGLAARAFDLEGMLVGPHRLYLRDAGKGIAIGGTIAPSNYNFVAGPTPGTMTLDSAATTMAFNLFPAGGVLDFNIGTTSDKIQITNTVAANGNATIVNNGTYALNVNQLAGFGVGQYTLISATGALTDNVPDSAWTFSPGGVYSYAISHDAQDLYLTVSSPEPATLSLLAFGLGGLLLKRRGRK